MNLDQKKIIILVNLDANDGRASRRWKEISEDVISRLPVKPEINEYHIGFDTRFYLQNTLHRTKFNYLISAGGDGSANIILNQLFALPDSMRSNTAFGFIGLGSSNDILKPFQRMIRKIPVCIDMDNLTHSDIGCAQYKNNRNELMVKYFLANSSIGVGADANWLFNKEDRVIRFLKSRFTHLAIIYAALKTIFSHRNFPIELSYNDQVRKVMASYLVVLKNPYISGDMKFDQNIMRDDGKLGLNICSNMTRLELIHLMRDLQKSKFSGKPNRFSLIVNELSIKTETLIPLEMDGEVEFAKDICYSVLPKSIKLLQ